MLFEQSRLFLSRFSKVFLSTKQIIYSEYGDSNKVLRLESKDIGEGKELDGHQVLVSWQASPINPADINQIQGVYPVKPPLPAIGGNEGFAVVIQTGKEVADLKANDFVIPSQAGLGTWCTRGIYDRSQLFPVPNDLDMGATATLQVNPSTAYRMLNDFVKLSPGDLVVQNGANSAVGQFVIQMCHILGVQTINVVRDRPNIDTLKSELISLGANEVLTEEEFSKMIRSNSLNAKLALNCVGGRSSLQLVRALGPGGCMVTYGGMSQQPVQLSTASLIFNDVTLRGFWISRWYEDENNLNERSKMYANIGEWYKSNQLKVPTHKNWSIEEFKEAIQQATGGPQQLKQRQMPITFTKAVEDFIFAEFQRQGEKTNAGEARRRAKKNFKNDNVSIPSKDTVRRWFRNWKKNKPADGPNVTPPNKESRMKQLEKMEKKMADMEKEHVKKMADMEKEHVKKMADMEKEHTKAIAAIKEQIDQMKNQFEQKDDDEETAAGTSGQPPSDELKLWFQDFVGI